MVITALETYSTEMTVNKSKFIGIIMPINSEDDVKDRLDEIMIQYPKATHYCYAYKFDASERAHDDGEPSRSAGFPLLQTINYQSLDHVLLVVVRYFGGSKLGLGRLTRVYREVGEECAKGVLKAEVVPGIKARIICEYSDFDQLKYTANKNDIKFEPIEFGTKISIEISSEIEKIDSFLEMIRDENIIEKTEINTYRRIEE